ncbi:hypothetical protein [Mycobacterium riyadhense]|uniref:SnoaL-like domain-containing protein n=1 Tax=Mycobacterium riyadhense TaxID=486698 RepID=A0A1X2CCE3_9MYCO|nr:hypothetical protein [Mycobacterium riyadhense]MCV7146962.1 hypothetical protein [Mycobacterium riyadhense]ORW73617.1 hypothetical protein AWC22_23885 [Mycobacterium riyadhense]VTP04445.1 hypothetical protein BIN_B_05544 [Mycobacterium riyadhense]
MGWLLFQQHQKDVATQQALVAAQTYMTVLVNIEPEMLDNKWFGLVLEGSTGEFREAFSKTRSQLREGLISHQASAHGTVIAGAVQSAATSEVVVVMFVDQVLTDADNPTPKLDRGRVVMVMDKVDGRWLASKVRLL